MRVGNDCISSIDAGERDENILPSGPRLEDKPKRVKYLVWMVGAVKLIPLLGLEAMLPSPPPRARLSARLRLDLQEPRGGKFPVSWSRYSAKVSIF